MYLGPNGFIEDPTSREEFIAFLHKEYIGCEEGMLLERAFTSATNAVGAYRWMSDSEVPLERMNPYAYGTVLYDWTAAQEVVPKVLTKKQIGLLVTYFNMDMGSPCVVACRIMLERFLK